MTPSLPVRLRPSRLRRVVATAAGVVGLAVLLGACIPLVDPPTSGRQFGRGPVDAVSDAADAHPKCAGLTSAELAAMMMVPTYPETGGPVPSPMTLGRSDTLAVWSLNRNLFAFSQTTGPYVNAYFTAGVGMWQFDSAGGWNLTAAGAIDAVSSARQAANTIAYRYCNPPSSIARDDVSLRRYSWGPWYGCSTGSGWNCEGLYQQLYENEALDTAVDDRVSRFGGMEQRSCDVAGLGAGLTCWYVDPARAQGSTGWRSGTYNPSNPNSYTPLPKPFYVLEANGREYRYWLPADTGFDIGITGHKRVTDNARTSLTWQRSAPLCDRTQGRGECGPVARVATTPWGPRTAEPFGALDSVTSNPDGSARVTGWALDPDTNAPIDVHFYVDGVGAAALTAGADRPDVAAAVPGYGAAHGYDTVIGVGAGTHEVCAFAINVGPYGGTNPVIGCRTVTIDGTPRGNLEGATPTTGGLRVTGWAIDADTVGPVDVHVYVDGAWGGLTVADRNRPDVGAAFPRLGSAHGFDLTVPTAGGVRRACAFAINAGPNGLASVALGCADGTVSGSPFGTFDGVDPAGGGALVSGWAIDPDTNDATVRVTVDGVAVSTLATSASRPDVGAAFPGRGDTHGFRAVVPAAPGPRTVCVSALNFGLGTTTSLGCRTVTVGTGDPFGNLEGASREGGGVRVSGWAIDPDTNDSLTLHVYVNGVFTAAPLADRVRSDVGAVFPGYGPSHGFSAVLPAPSGATVCVFALNRGPGSANTLLGCRVA